jgi:hypothetical protein
VPANRESFEFERISQLRYVVWPIQQAPALLEIRGPAAGPINRYHSYPEVSGDFIVWGEVESRTDPTVKEEDRDGFAISVLLIPDLPAIRELDMTGFDHQFPPYLPDKVAVYL